MVRWVILALLAWGSFASVALAQEGDPGSGAATGEARAHFDRGTEAFDVGEYERAAQEFRAAYELTEHPDLLFNIYSSLERGGQLAEAADALEAYLRDGDPDDERRTALQARLARMRERLAEARAAEAEAQLEAARAADREPEDDVAPPPPEDRAPPPEPDPGGVHPAGVGVLIGGGVLLANFAVFAGLAAAEDGSLADGCSPSCSDDEVSTLQTFSLVADVSWIAGAVVVATGIVLLLALPAESDADTSAAVAPWVGPDGAGLVLAGRIR